MMQEITKERPLKIQTEFLVIPGDRVFVENYRCRPVQWGYGTVRTVEVRIHNHGNKLEMRASYWVELDRKSARGNMLTVTVEDGRIQLKYD